MERQKPVEVVFNGSKISVVLGDIVEQEVDAIVNAANNRLAGGGGVDGAIHRAAGWRQLQKALRKIGYCETGDAVVTPGFNLRAKYIIHTVGPIYAAGPVNKEGRKHNERADQLLASCYRRCFEVAASYGVQTIAFPAISTGIYEYPVEKATEIAIGTVKDFILTREGFDEVRFVTYDEYDTLVYEEELARQFRI